MEDVDSWNIVDMWRMRNIVLVLIILRTFALQEMGDPHPVEDARFSKLGTEKRFRRAGKKHSKKVKIDSRFQGLFTQEKFVSKCAVDKRGRPRYRNILTIMTGNKVMNSTLYL